ncbi:hypothetical protein M408DRAFT_67731 [Serendipita vermifera MAFF 305830]|uniref:Ribosome-assembly protein 3 C-terminal domain-containing protein n=1 Tax=Serendipita vermifera MAFF 305830 TaxID=933852 RepID=A0A0C3AY58_SERVB|nr:hypothetical protein M408DRAFT_67731 [Serendipita vermifera MAFF 305830]
MKSPTKDKTRLPSRSPSPADHTLPSGIYLNPSTEEEKRKDAEMKERFRKFWMMTTAEGFRDELGQIQTEPNMTQSKLAMLIDALSAGANNYMPSNNGTGSTSGQSEVELLLGVHK